MGMMHVLLVCLLLWYVAWLMYQRIAWWMYPATKLSASDQDLPSVTVIVPARNEALRIERVLRSLLAQDYPADRLQLIVSDDHSEDHIVETAAALFAPSKFNCRILQATESDALGKKAALMRAIEVAHGDIILTTDADCHMSPQWVRSMATKFSDPSIHMVTGMVVLDAAPGLIARLERLDQLALSTTGATTMMAHAPLLCSGANLAFRKHAFHEVGGYTLGKDDPSGDDTYLMLQMGRSVAFNKSRASVVYTQPQQQLQAIFNQRKRWASKVRGYPQKRIAFTGAWLGLINLLPWVMCAMVVTGQMHGWFLLLWMATKCLFDVLYLAPMARYFGQQQILWVSPLYAVLYPIYALVALFSVFKKGYEWKGRRYAR